METLGSSGEGASNWVPATQWEAWITFLLPGLLRSTHKCCRHLSSQWAEGSYLALLLVLFLFPSQTSIYIFLKKFFFLVLRVGMIWCLRYCLISHICMHRFKPQLLFKSSFLLKHPLGTSSWWPECLDPCHQHCCGLATALSDIWGVDQQTESSCHFFSHTASCFCLSSKNIIDYKSWFSYFSVS